MTVAQLAARVADLFEQDQYKPAEHLIQTGLKQDPQHPDLCAAQVHMMLWTQREIECALFVEHAQHSRLFPNAAQMAVDALACRKLMAERLGHQDPNGEEALNHLVNLGLSPSANVGIGVTAALIVKNEEKFLGNCLASLAGIVDEIVVVDTGSTDRTIEIAEEFGAQIHHTEWTDDFSAARNVSLEAATQPWILIIDADEELTPASVTMLREAVMRPQFGGYTVEIVNQVNGEEEVFVHHPVRLFRNDPRVRFTGKIHEQIVHGILELKWRIADLPGISLIHHGYTSSLILERGKIERTVSMLLKAIEDEPNFSFHYFNLANAYYTGREYDRAAEAATRAINLLEPRASYAHGCYDVLCSSLLQLGRLGEVMEWVERAERAGLHSMLLEYHRCEALQKLGRMDEALRSSLDCLKMEWKPGLSGDKTVATLRRHLQAARVRLARGEFSACLTHCESLLKRFPGCTTASGLRASALVGLHRFENALAALEPCLHIEEERTDALALQAEILAQLGRFEDVLTVGQLAYEGNHMSAALATRWRLAALQHGTQALRDAASMTLEHFPPDLFEQVQMALAAPFEEGINQLVSLWEQNPGAQEVAFTLGDLLAKQQRWNDAAEAYAAGLRLDPNQPDGWFVLGNCLAYMGAAEGALGAYAQCLKLNPNHPGARHNSAQISTESAA